MELHSAFFFANMCHISPNIYDHSLARFKGSAFLVLNSVAKHNPW